MLKLEREREAILVPAVVPVAEEEEPAAANYQEAVCILPASLLMASKERRIQTVKEAEVASHRIPAGKPDQLEKNLQEILSEPVPVEAQRMELELELEEAALAEMRRLPGHPFFDRFR